MPPISYAQAFAQMSAKLDNQLDDMIRVNASMDMRLVARRSALSRLTESSQDKLAGADARQTLHDRMVNPAGNPSYQGRALSEAVEGLREQERVYARIRVLNDPEVQRENFRLSRLIAEEEKKREVARVRSGLDPRGLANQVRLDRQLMNARKELDLATAKEGGRQTPWKTLGGAAMDIGRSLPGGGMLGGIGNVVGAATGKGASAVSGALGGLGMSAAAAGPIGAIVAAVPAVIGSLGQFAGALDQLKGTIVSLAGFASPGALIRWNLAMDRATATLGRSLIPVLDTLTHGLQIFGDVLASVLPSQAEMRAAMEPVNQALRELRPVLADMVPLWKELANVGLRSFAKALELATAGMRVSSNVSLALQRSAAGLWGFQLPEGKGLDKAAPPPGAPKFQQVEDYLREVSVAALTQAMGVDADPTKQTAKNTKDLLDEFKQFKEAVWAVLNGDVGGDVRGAVEGAQRGRR